MIKFMDKYHEEFFNKKIMEEKDMVKQIYIIKH